VVPRIAKRNGVRFSFMGYLTYGLPMMIGSILICQAYVWLRYF
jgi:Na+/H+ antiporter NhaD/arsenite permease-like protein